MQSIGIKIEIKVLVLILVLKKVLITSLTECSSIVTNWSRTTAGYQYVALQSVGRQCGHQGAKEASGRRRRYTDTVVQCSAANFSLIVTTQ